VTVSVMVDKEFNPFESSWVSINIPTIFHKKNRLSGRAVLKDRKLATT